MRAGAVEDSEGDVILEGGSDGNQRAKAEGT